MDTPQHNNTCAFLASSEHQKAAAAARAAVERSPEAVLPCVSGGSDSTELVESLALSLPAVNNNATICRRGDSTPSSHQRFNGGGSSGSVGAQAHTSTEGASGGEEGSTGIGAQPPKYTISPADANRSISLNIGNAISPTHYATHDQRAQWPVSAALSASAAPSPDTCRPVSTPQSSSARSVHHRDVNPPAPLTAFGAFASLNGQSSPLASCSPLIAMAQSHAAPAPMQLFTAASGSASGSCAFSAPSGPSFMYFHPAVGAPVGHSPAHVITSFGAEGHSTSTNTLAHPSTPSASFPSGKHTANGSGSVSNEATNSHASHNNSSEGAGLAPSASPHLLLSPPPIAGGTLVHPSMSTHVRVTMDSGGAAFDAALGADAFANSSTVAEERSISDLQPHDSGGANTISSMDSFLRTVAAAGYRATMAGGLVAPADNASPLAVEGSPQLSELSPSPSTAVNTTARHTSSNTANITSSSGGRPLDVEAFNDTSTVLASSSSGWHAEGPAPQAVPLAVAVAVPITVLNGDCTVAIPHSTSNSGPAGGWQTRVPPLPPLVVNPRALPVGAYARNSSSSNGAPLAISDPSASNSRSFHSHSQSHSFLSNTATPHHIAPGIACSPALSNSGGGAVASHGRPTAPQSGCGLTSVASHYDPTVGSSPATLHGLHVPMPSATTPLHRGGCGASSERASTGSSVGTHHHTPFPLPPMSPCIDAPAGPIPPALPNCALPRTTYSPPYGANPSALPTGGSATTRLFIPPPPPRAGTRETLTAFGTDAAEARRVTEAAAARWYVRVCAFIAVARQQQLQSTTTTSGSTVGSLSSLRQGSSSVAAALSPTFACDANGVGARGSGSAATPPSSHDPPSPAVFIVGLSGINASSPPPDPAAYLDPDQWCSEAERWWDVTFAHRTEYAVIGPNADRPSVPVSTVGPVNSQSPSCRSSFAGVPRSPFAALQGIGLVARAPLSVVVGAGGLPSNTSGISNKILGASLVDHANSASRLPPRCADLGQPEELVLAGGWRRAVGPQNTPNANASSAASSLGSSAGSGHGATLTVRVGSALHAVPFTGVPPHLYHQHRTTSTATVVSSSPNSSAYASATDYPSLQIGLPPSALSYSVSVVSPAADPHHLQQQFYPAYSHRPPPNASADSTVGMANVPAPMPLSVGAAPTLVPGRPPLCLASLQPSLSNQPVRSAAPTSSHELNTYAPAAPIQRTVAVSPASHPALRSFVGGGVPPIGSVGTGGAEDDGVDPLVAPTNGGALGGGEEGEAGGGGEKRRKTRRGKRSVQAVQRQHERFAAVRGGFGRHAHAVGVPAPTDGYSSSSQ